MTGPHHDLSVSRRAALAGLGAGGLALATRGLIASAQDSSPVATSFSLAGHPLIGAWQWSSPATPPGENDGYAIVDEDGTYVDYNAFTGVGMGLWEATGERTAEVVVTSQKFDRQEMFAPDYVPALHVLGPEIATLWLTIEVDATGNVLTATSRSEARDATGEIVFTDESYAPTGERLQPGCGAATPRA